MQIDLDELVASGVVSEQTADAIRQFYSSKQPQQQSRVLVAFGILGALLVGLGIILIIAHNWDDLQRWFKTLLAFIPLLVGQKLCAFVLLRKNESVAWRESAAVFLFLAVGANISIISQIYHLGGSVSSFLFSWMLLCLPVVYVMRSSMASLLYLLGITYYACETGYWASYDGGNPHFFWLLLLAVFPHYFWLIRNQAASNFTLHHHRWIALAVAVSLGTVAKNSEEWMAVAYMSLFSLFWMLGRMLVADEYKRIGGLGIVSVWLVFSFRWLWETISKSDYAFKSPEFAVATSLTLAAAAFYFFLNRKHGSDIDVFEICFLWFVAVFVVGIFSVIGATVLANITALGLGVLGIVRGARSQSLKDLNFGLLVVAALIVCRFFDTNMSFVVRGILFVLVGLGFFIANYSMMKKKNASR